MVTNYKKVGIDIAEIKKSQGAIGENHIINTQDTEISKSDSWFWTLCWNSTDSWEQIFGYAYRWSWYKDYDC